MRTTPPPPVDYASLFPELSALRTTTLRLHPRRAEGLAAEASKIGGAIVWPAGERWPHCGSSGCGCGGGPLVVVMQLRRADAPRMPFPEGTDVFQLLWCPRDPEGLGPSCQTFWRPMSNLLVAAESPERKDADDQLVPRSCTLIPETVSELPSISQLPEPLRAVIWAYEEEQHEGRPVYQYLASVADGTKVGGYVDWIQDPFVPNCPAGHVMDHLLTVASAEFDGGTWPRWCPIEDQHVWGGDYKLRWAVQSAPDLMLGDMGKLYVFCCTRCSDRPIVTLHQCS